MISIIIPIYNEEHLLLQNRTRWSALAEKAELIFVDGGSRDMSPACAQHCGRVLNAPKGRAAQMNHGAREAGGDILLFLHADTMVRPGTLGHIEQALRPEDRIGGCLTQRIDHPSPVFRLIEWQGNVRARVSRIFYGDQGIFVRREVFAKIGGFPKVPIMEDVLFTRKLKKTGKTVVLNDAVSVSPRRWQKKGVLRTVLLYQWIILLFRFGVPLEQIRKCYDDVR